MKRKNEGQIPLVKFTFRAGTWLQKKWLDNDLAEADRKQEALDKELQEEENWVEEDEKEETTGDEINAKAEIKGEIVGQVVDQKKKEEK